MNDLLSQIIATHGGMERWRRYEKVQATIVSSGGLFRLKGMPQDPTPRRMTAWLHQERASIIPFGAPDQFSMFTPDRVAIEKLGGTVIAERLEPVASFSGHQMATPWDPLQRAYFNGEAMWTYLTTPFLLAMDGVETDEMEPWNEGEETWRVLRATFPSSLETHSRVQLFYFGDDMRLRRHDYNVDVAGGFDAAQLTSDYVEADGILLPTRRRAYMRGPDRRPITELMMVTIELSDISFR